jgi:hypothetical protein
MVAHNDDMSPSRIPALRALTGLALVLTAVGCDQRLLPTAGGIKAPIIDVPTGGAFQLRAVNNGVLPHVTVGGGSEYRLVSGSFQLNADSTWHFHSNTLVFSESGQPLGASPANYTGRWVTTDSTIELVTPASGSVVIKGDTLYWTGGPKYPWELPLRFALTK